MKFLNKDYSENKMYIIIFSFCFLFVLPIILSNVPYMDDNTRMDNGVGYWEIEGRPITTIIFKMLNFSYNEVYNIAPLPLIVGLLFFSFSASYSIFNSSIRKNIFNILPFCFLICNPFFLQNLSYQYDSIGHIFSISFILFSIFYNSKNVYKKHIYPVIFIIASCASYQLSTNLYISLFVITFIFNLKDIGNEKNYSYIFRYILYYISGVFIYYILYFIGFSFLFTEISERNSLIYFNEIYRSYIISSFDFLSLFSLLLNNVILKVLFILFFIMLLINIIINIIKIIKNKSSYAEKTTGVNFSLLSPFILYLSIWGPFILLNELLFNPRDFPIIGSFFMIFSFSFINIDFKNNIFKILNLFIITLWVFSLSYMYGNTLHYDNEYKKYVYNSISMDLENEIDIIKDKKIMVYGQSSTTAYIYHAFKINPFIEKLIFPENTNFFKKYNLSSRNIYNIVGGAINDDYEEWKIICDQKIPSMVKNRNYAIFNFEDHISIWFKNNPDLCKNEPTDSYNKFYYKKEYLKNNQQEKN